MSCSPFSCVNDIIKNNFKEAFNVSKFVDEFNREFHSQYESEAKRLVSSPFVSITTFVLQKVQQENKKILKMKNESNLIADKKIPKSIP